MGLLLPEFIEELRFVVKMPVDSAPCNLGRVRNIVKRRIGNTSRSKLDDCCLNQKLSRFQRFGFCFLSHRL